MKMMCRPPVNNTYYLYVFFLLLLHSLFLAIRLVACQRQQKEYFFCCGAANTVYHKYSLKMYVFSACSIIVKNLLTILWFVHECTQLSKFTDIGW